MIARGTAQTAEDARVIALRRQQEEALQKEREAAAREAEAKRQADEEQRRREQAEADRKAAEGRRAQAEAAQATGEAEKASAGRQRLEAELAAAKAAEQAKARGLHPCVLARTGSSRAVLRRTLRQCAA